MLFMKLWVCLIIVLAKHWMFLYEHPANGQASFAAPSTTEGTALHPPLEKTGLSRSDF
jgi:hypothetical protein